MMNINLEDIEAFCIVVEEKSISKAAKKLHMTQPALSQRIGSLEQSMGITLLQRTHKGVTMTAGGEILYNLGQRMLNLGERLDEELERLRTSAKDQIIIGASTTLGGYALPCTLVYFKELNPDADIRMVVDNTEKVISKLLDGTIDMALVEENIEIPKMTSSHLTQDELVLIVPPTQEWKEREYLELAELVNLPFLSREKGSGTRKVIESILSQHGVNPEKLNVIMELNSVDAIKAMVEANQGVALLSRLVIRKELAAGLLHVVPIKGLSFIYDFIILYQQDQPLSDLQTRFLDLMEDPEKRRFCNTSIKDE